MNEATKTPARYLAFFAAAGALAVTTGHVTAGTVNAPTVAYKVAGATIAGTSVNAPTCAYRVVLSNRLLAYWSFEEASGPRVDAKGYHNLIPFGTPGSAAGKVGDALHLVAADSYGLAAQSPGAFRQGSFDYGFTCWVKATTLPASAMYVYAKDDNVNREFGLLIDNTVNAFVAFMQFTDNSTLTVADTTALSTGTYYFVAFWYDPVGETLNIQVNDGTVFQTSTAGKTPKETTSTFMVGARRSNSPTSYFNGDVDELNYSRPSLSADQRTYLYNGGSGRAFAALEAYVGAAIPTGNVLFPPTVSQGGGAQAVTAGTVAAGTVNPPSTAYRVSGPTIASGHTLGVPTVAYKVNASTIASGSALFPPTLAYKVTAGTVAPGSLFPPTITTGNAVLGGTVASANALFPPTVLAEQAVTTGHISATAVNAPTVSYRVVTGTIAAGTVLFGPTVLADQAVTAGTISATALFPPSVTTGNAILGATIASGNALFPPTVIPDQAVTTGTVSGTVLFPPTLAYRVVTGTIAAGTVLFSPTVLAEQAVTAGHVSATTLFPPAVTLEGGVSTGEIPSGNQLFPPTLRLNVTSGFRSSALTLNAPSLAYRVAGGTISATQLFPPTLAYRVRTGTISATALFAPTVVEEKAIVGATVSSTLALFPPSVIVEQQVTTGTISSTVVNQPSAAYRVVLAHIPSTLTLYPPTIAVGAAQVTLPIISGTVLYPPEVGSSIIYSGLDQTTSTVIEGATSSEIMGPTISVFTLPPTDAD